MFPTELEINQRRKDLQREAEHHSLVQSVRQPRPSLIERLAARFSAMPVRAARFEIEPAAHQSEATA